MLSAVDHLRTLFGHHRWATVSLLDLCEQLPAEQLELTSPGTYGSIHATLEHLVRSDFGYLRRFTGEERMEPSSTLPPLASLRADMDRYAGRWLEVLDRIDGLDVSMPEEPGEYPHIERAAGLFMTQALHHGNEHRAHVLTILGAHGLEAPELSAWEYFRFLNDRGEA